MLTMSNMGDHVWLMTSRQTEPDSSSMLAAATRGPESAYSASDPRECLTVHAAACRPREPLDDHRATPAQHPHLVGRSHSHKRAGKRGRTVEDLVGEADRGRLVGVAVGELDVDLPGAALERS